MNNEKIKAALDFIAEEQKILDDVSGWTLQEQDGDSAKERHIAKKEILQTIRSALEDCLWCFDMELAPRDEAPILIIGGQSISDLGDELIDVTEPVKVKWIAELEWDSEIEKMVGCWVICDYCYYQVKVYNPTAWRRIDAPEEK